MSSQQRTYVVSLLEDNLGLAGGALDGQQLPSNLVEEVCSTLQGRPSRGTEDPYLEKMFLSFLAEVKERELERRGFFVRKARWPRGVPFAVCLTHDVDNISRPLAHAWRTRNRFSSADFLGNFLRVSPIYNNISQIASEEGRRGFHSSFYFLTSHYPLDRVSRAAAKLSGEGWDVGLHGDFGTHDSAKKMEEALGAFSTALAMKPRGVREHYLRFDFGKTWEIMNTAGFDYDTTVGLNDRLGFKVGLATPFHPPDSLWRPLQLLELPLTLMDTTLWGYLKKDEQSGMREIRSMVEKVKGIGGLFTLLWHQEAVKMTGGRLYWQLLDQFMAEGCFVASGAEVADWWLRRSTPLVVDGNRFHFNGNAPLDSCLLVQTRDKTTVKVVGGTLRSNDGLSTIQVDAAGMSGRVA